MWKNRITATIYSSKDEQTNKRVYRNLNWGFSDQNLLESLNKNSTLNLSIEDGVFEYGDNNIIDQFLFSLDWSLLNSRNSQG